jgi:hypothetical protein
VHTIFENDTCEMVQGVMVLLRWVKVGNLYNLLGNTITYGCNSIIVPENEFDKTYTLFIEKTMVWHETMGHIGEKGLCDLHTKGIV